MQRPISLLLASVPWLAAVLPAQGVSWSRLTPNTSPSARWSPGMAYDSARDRVVLFGGRSQTQHFDDTWEWDGKDWTRKQTGATMPSKRTAFDSMVYDTSRHRVLLFGGWAGGSNSHLNDTWEWDGTAWTEIKPTTRPPARGIHSVAYDSGRGRAVLFGGSDGTTNLGDTWEWTGSDWIKLQPATSPSARRAHVMVYDAARAHVVLFGGIDGNGGKLNDTWLWNGKDWVRANPTTSPPVLSWVTLAYDAARARVVLFGGLGNGGAVNDTWEWDGSTWLKRSPTSSPSARCCTDLTFLGKSGRSLAFGGSLGSQNAIAETIEYGPNSPASVSSFGAGCAGTIGTPQLAAAIGSLPWLGESLEIELSRIPNGTALLLIGTSNRTWGSVALPLPLDGIGMPGCNLLVSPDVTVPLVASGGTARLRASICRACSAMIGVSGHLQGAATDPRANALGLVASNGITATIGAK